MKFKKTAKVVNYTGDIIHDKRGYYRVYGQPVHATNYTCDYCGTTRLGFGICEKCGSFVNTLSKEYSKKMKKDE